MSFYKYVTGDKLSSHVTKGVTISTSIVETDIRYTYVQPGHTCVQPGQTYVKPGHTYVQGDTEIWKKQKTKLRKFQRYHVLGQPMITTA